MTVPMPNGKPLKVASTYVPAQAQDREHFIRRLALTSCLEGTEILGTDANCVPNVKIDVKHTDDSKHTYSNLHARKLENHLASLVMRDTSSFHDGQRAFRLHKGMPNCSHEDRQNLLPSGGTNDRLATH